MSLPTYPDRASIIAYMRVRLGTTGTTLGLDGVSLRLEEAVNDLLYDYFGPDGGELSDVGDVPRLRALAVYHAWVAAYEASADMIDVTEGPTKINIGALQDKIAKNVLEASKALGRDDARSAVVFQPFMMTSVRVARTDEIAR